MLIRQIRQLFLHGLSGIAQIVFSPQPLAGGIFLLAVLAYSPFLALACLVGAIVANGAAALGKRPHDAIAKGLYGYNGALLGLAFATFQPHDPLLWGYIAFTAVLSVFLYELFLRCGIPPYTMPYVTLTWLVLALVAPAQSSDAAPVAGWTIPLIGMGQIFFLPSILSGLLILFGIAIAGPARMLPLTICGALIGCLPFLWAGKASYLTAGLSCVNAALSALGILQVQTRLPVSLSVCFALAATLLYPLCFALLGSAGLPALTFPFIVTMWLGLGLRAMSAKRKRGSDHVVSS